MSVDIKIDLDAKGVADDIVAIKTALESLDDTSGDIDLGKQINSDGITGELGQVIKKMKEVDDQMGNLNARLNNINDVEFDDVDVTKTIKEVDGSTGSGDSTGGDPPDKGGGGGLSRDRQNKLLSSLLGDDIKGVLNNKDLNYMRNDFAPWAKDRDIHLSNEDKQTPLRKRSYGEFGFGMESVAQRDMRRAELSSDELADLKSGGSDRGSGFSTRAFRKYDIDFEALELDDLERKFGRMGGKAKRLIPDMHQLYNVLAAIIPIAIVLGAQMLGVASAMAAVGVAGASIIGLGLIGHADNMNEALAEAKKNLKDLAEGSFDAFQGTAQIFAPIQERMFAAIPGQLRQISREMEGLKAYEGTLFQLGGMLSEGLQYSLNAIAENEEAISQLAIRFSSIVGSGILEFFGWLFEQARDNQNILISLGGTLKDLATIVFRVFNVLVMFLDTFSPLIDIILFLSQALNNQLFQALLGFAGAAYLTAGALTKMGLAALKAYAFLANVGMINWIMSSFYMVQAGITRLIAHYTALSAAAANAAAMMAMTGIGLLAVGAGAYVGYDMLSSDSGSTSGSGSGTGGASGGNVYNDNRKYTINNNGESDYASQKGWEDTVKEVNETESAMSPPPTDGDSGTSDGQ